MRSVLRTLGGSTLLALALVVSLAAQDVASIPLESVITLEVPGASTTMPAAINARGDVAGSFFDGRFHGFVWSRGRYTMIDIPNAQNTRVTGLNDRGDLVGWTATEAFVMRGDSITFLQKGPRGERLTPLGINNRGEIVGTVFVTFPIISQEAFWLDSTGTLQITRNVAETDYSAINNSGEIVGSLGIFDHFGFVIDRNGTQLVIGGPNPSTRPRGINARGDIVGYVRPRVSPDRAFIRYPDGTVDFFTIGNEYTRLTGINARGDVVGEIGLGSTKGFIITH